MKKRILITVYGRVQGVGFRYYVHKNAAILGLVGSVKNIEDDKVEVIAEGELEKLETLLEKCKKGPGFSRVEKVSFDYEEFLGTFKSFEIR